MRIRGQEDIGVYVHIPFCASKCPYCGFRSAVAGEIPEKRYADCLVRELSGVVSKEALAGRPLGSVYIGGGTPSLLSPSAISRIVESVKAPFKQTEDCEVTVEVNPDSATPQRIGGYAAGGVNRLSLGVQSFDDSLLKRLSRAHGAKKALEAFTLAREAGFKNIGVDLIFGIPGQTVKGWEGALRELIRLCPEHISLYGLTIEEGTPYYGIYGKGGAGMGLLPPEDAEAAMFRMAQEMLGSEGWRHYEISNYARAGFESVHNTGYWLGREYIGLGAAAHSFFSAPGWGRRLWNEPDPYGYMERIEAGGSAVEGGETLKKEEAIAESLMLGLRMLERGIKGEEFKARFGAYPKEVLRDWAALENEGLLRTGGEDIILTARGALVSNEVFLSI